MAVQVATTDRREASRWTPARIFMAISAVWHLPLGIVGLLYDQTFPIGPEAAASAESDHIFGIFETNGWHSVAGLLLGVVSLYFLVRPSRAREAAIAIGVFHVGVVVALTVWSPETFWLASNAADQVIHSSTAIGGIVSGVMSRSSRVAP